MKGKPDIISSLWKILLFTFFIPLISSSQSVYYKQYDIRNGLPSSQVFDVKFDRNGYLWFATENGVCCYDGFEFRTYSAEDGLPIESTVILDVDYRGRIWFLGYSGALSYFEKNHIIDFPYNDSLLKLIPNNYIADIDIDSSENMLISPKGGGLIKVNNDGRIEVLNKIKEDADEIIIKLSDFGRECFMALLDPRDQSVSGLVLNENEYLIPEKYDKRYFHRYYHKFEAGDYLISHGKKIYHIVDGNIQKKLKLKSNITGIFVDKSGNLWLTMPYDRGVYMYPDGDLEKAPLHYFRGKTISKVIQDREQNYWFTTLDEGVLFVPSFNFKIFNDPETGDIFNIVSMDLEGERMYFSTMDRRLYGCAIFEGDLKNISRINMESAPTDWIFDIEVDDDGSIWVASSTIMHYRANGEPDAPEDPMIGWEIEEGSDDKILVGNYGIAVYKDNKLLFYEREELDKRIYSIQEDERGNIWLGTLYGLYKFDSVFTYFENWYGGLQQRITALGMCKDYLLVGTTSKGLLILKNDTVHHIINKANGLSNNLVRAMYTDGDSVIWISTNQGISKIRCLDLSHKIFDIDNYGIDDGLPSRKIVDIKRSGKYIWLGTDKGLISFDPARFIKRETPPPIEVRKLTVNNKDLPYQDKYILKHEENNVRVHFRSISFRGPERIKYRYKLVNFIDERIVTNNTYADFPNLPSGEYIFYVNAGYHDDLWNENPQEIRIIIQKHFTETAWFISLVIISGLLLITSIVLMILRYQRRKEQHRKELLKLEHKLFRSQLNPHFIFNSLLAIQSFIYKNNSDEAARYLSNFAKLIRHILTLTEEETVSIDNELDFIKNYLELQKLRFNNKFDYSIRIDPGLNTEVAKIPPMLAQPFIENAIEHGVQHKEGKGNIYINLSHRDRAILFEIRDDGIGRKNSNMINQRQTLKYKSFGTTIIRDRIKLLNRIYEDQIRLNIYDMTDETNKPTGTKVELRIPYDN